MDSGPDREQLREILHGFAMITQVGLLMAASILAGLLIGRWLAGSMGGILGILLGVAAGFYNCYRVLTRPDERRRKPNDGSK